VALHLSEFQQLKGLDLFANQVAEGFITGLHKSPFHGFSVEFAEHRLYNTGESTKHIDWKLFARSDKLFVKRYEEETNLRCSILIDTSSSMYFGKNSSSTKIGFALHAAATLTNLLKKQRDAFGVTFFDEDIHLSTDIKSNEAHYHFVLSKLHEVLNSERKEKKSSLAQTIHQIAETAHRRSLVILFTDMFDNMSEFDKVLSALQHLKHNKHEVVLFHVLDKSQEIELDFENRPYIFIDKETYEQIKLNPTQVQEQYKTKASAFSKEVKNKCLSYKIDYVDSDINDGYNAILLQYLIKRSKMLR
jgi:uncharacterized protein (DUF58 family)